mmetsp:Transcript_12802/g.23570  ORF Transcript_12802/g.23570 Transcript_12802/m.23570 type:complete len:604 (-) Transcript_12802:1652-3463(-)
MIGQIWKVPGNVLQRRVASSSWSWRAAGASSCSSTCHHYLPTVAAPSHHHNLSFSSLAGDCIPPANTPITPDSTTVRHNSTSAINGEVEECVGEAALSGDGYLSKMLNAKVYEVAIETELQHAKNLSQLLNNTIFLKREDTQPVFSFKIRGAYNKMASLPQSALSRGVVACSAGNHAQGVALSARMLGCRAVICMPVATPSIKVNAVRAHGGETVEVRLFGNNYDETATEAIRLQYEEGLAMIHPFDDPLVIAGQGTIAIEILKKCVSEPVDAIFVCCGGGGMLAGISAYVKQVRPNVKIYGVEAADAAGMTASLAAGKVVTLDSVGLFADGAAVKTIGTESFRLCQKYVDGMVTVNTDQICNAIKLAYNDARVILEPAGALAVAGLKKHIEENNISGSTFVAITSGANMDFNRLRVVSERADDSERSLEITIPETPGAFRAMYSKIWPRNVTELTYRFNTEQEANVFVSFQPLVHVENDFEQVMEEFKNDKFPCTNLSDNELAKTHIRHLAGGRSNADHERVFRFDFPESPGALMRFLEALDMKWNISLFHYRNYGDDFGRVLVGIQQNHGMKCEGMNKFLQDLGYTYIEETSNPAYEKFLR